MKYGYARISTVHQRKAGNSLEDQRLRLQQEGCDFIVEEQFTGARMDRPKFQWLCALLEEGDMLVVCKLDRFARTVVEGALTCREIKGGSGFPCEACVNLAASLAEKMK